MDNCSIYRDVKCGMGHFRLSDFISIFRLPLFKARLAIYDPINQSGEMQVITERNLKNMLTTLATKTHQLHCECGGNLPSQAIKEVIDNLVHAEFADPLITIFSDGSAVRVADQGPGIAKKDHAVLPGFTSATPKQRRYIRGLGQGLPLVSFYLEQIGGQLEISDNLQQGTVVTLWAKTTACTRDLLPVRETSAAGSGPPVGERLQERVLQADPFASLTDRQRAILTVLRSQGPLGPSKVAEYIQTSPSSAYRDMVVLTELGLLIQTEGGKRMLNPQLEQDNMEF